MLQGILHYMSSLLHCTLMNFMRNSISLKIGRRTHKILPSGEIKEVPVLVDVAVSSYDSEILTSFLADNSQHLNKSNIMLAVCYKFGSLFLEIVGIYDSVKVTSLTLLVSEFRSEFTFHNNCIKPLFRWITTDKLLREPESLSSRQEEMAYNLTTVLFNGRSFILTVHRQIGKTLLHYNLLGSSVSPFLNKALWRQIDTTRRPRKWHFSHIFSIICG